VTGPVNTQVDVPGGTLFIRAWVSDKGHTPILLFHDSLGCVDVWRDFPALLAAQAGRTVIAYDRLGFGRSTARRDQLGPGFVAAEAGVVGALRTALGLDDLILLGHSVGGGMAIATAAAMPDAVRAVVTIAAQAFVEDRTLAGIREAQRTFAEPGQMERLARYHGDKAPWVLEAWTGTWLSPGFASWTLDTALDQVRCPVLALHGDRDEFGSPRHPARIAGGANRRAVMLADCGHVPQRERPDDVLALVGEFLKDLP
jgi:pimeloyl-ACP methyl ester carboxylesterase